MKGRVLLAALVLALGAGPGFAANARHPYRNIDPRVDAGNDTGNAQVEDLNRSQLGGNYYGLGRGPAPYYAPRPYYPAPGFYEPPPYGYAPPY